MIDLNQESYIRWVYYNIEKISFNDEILNIISVFGEGFDYRIEKPGKNIDVYLELKEKINDIKNYEKNSPFNWLDKQEYSALMKRKRGYINRKSSKKNMQRLNHGHFKKHKNYN